MSSELTYYTSLYGPEILLLLNVAYFVPSVPIMVLQTLTDTAFDRAFGVASATAYRFVIGASCFGPGPCAPSVDSCQHQHVSYCSLLHHAAASDAGG